MVANVLVHDGASCGCWPQNFNPSLGSDHNLITFDLLIKSAAPSTVPRWPKVCNWAAIVRALRPNLLQWASKIMTLRDSCSAANLQSKRATVEILYGEFVSLMPGQRAAHTPRRPQPDWWDFECYDAMASRKCSFPALAARTHPSCLSSFLCQKASIPSFSAPQEGPVLEHVAPHAGALGT